MDPADKQLERMVTSIRDAWAEEEHTAEDIRQARARFLQQFATHNRTRVLVRPPVRRVPVWAALAVATTAAIALWAWKQRPISFRSDSPTVSTTPGDLIEAFGSTPLPLQFSEGSTVTLHRGGRLRVIGTDSAGARVLVESGTVDVSIAHRRLGRTRWNFEAGSFHVVVTGTRFRLAFQQQNQKFRLDMDQGRVVVSGACLAAPTTVVAGGTLDLSCQPSATLIDDTSAVAPPIATEERPSAPSVRDGRRPSGHGVDSWRELLATGRLADGLRAAERQGFDDVCAVATSKELLELADAARLFGRSRRAVAALQTVRQRFPASPDAATAAFSLGRIAFEKHHAYGDAATWFDTYLREQPSGPLMGDAFGRLMEARQRSGDTIGARLQAQQYLRRFPQGPYATEARTILSK